VVKRTAVRINESLLIIKLVALVNPGHVFDRVEKPLREHSFKKPSRGPLIKRNYES